MKQKEYNQWNVPQEFYSDDYFLPKKGVAILHEYLVECYQYYASQFVQRYIYVSCRCCVVAVVL